MKVLSIIGSPRKGNSLKVAQRVETILKTFKDVNLEYIFLGDSNIFMCKGCCTCFAKNEYECPITDDIKQIVQKMIEADGVIFVTPTYSMNMSSLMKTFIDRISYISHRACFFEKAALLINTSAGTGIKDTLKSLTWPVSSFGFYITGKLGIATKTYAISEIPEKYNKVIDKEACLFFNAIKNKKHQTPRLLSLINFKCLQAIYSSAISKEIESGDIKYWKSNGWLDKGCDYYIEISKSSIKILIAKIITKLIVR